MYKLSITVIYFFFYSLLGWIVESIYCSIGERKLINRGFLTGPICPIYGTGAVVMSLFLTPIKNLNIPFTVFGRNFSFVPILIFLVGLLLADTVEFFTSLIMEKLFHARWWDYSDKPFNIQGRICLQHSVYWGMASIVFMYLVHPFFADILGKLFPLTAPKRLYLVLALILFVFLLDLANAVKNALDVKSLMGKLNKLTGSMVSFKDEAINIFNEKFGELQAGTTKRLEGFNKQINDVFWAFGFKGKAKDTKAKEADKNRLLWAYPNFRRRVKEQLSGLEEILDEIKHKFSDDDTEMY